MKKLVAIILFIIVLWVAFISSPLSYFYVTFKEPIKPQEFLDYLKDNGINPKSHAVYILSCALDQPEGLNRADYIRQGIETSDAVFNSHLYAIKALFDQRVKSWEFAGPEHPYD